MAHDKKLHFVAGFIIACIGSVIFKGIDPFYPLLGFLSGAFVGAAKELVWDYALGKGTPEFQDFLATAGGSIVGAIVGAFAVWIISLF